MVKKVIGRWQNRLYSAVMQKLYHEVVRTRKALKAALIFKNGAVCVIHIILSI